MKKITDKDVEALKAGKKVTKGFLAQVRVRDSWTLVEGFSFASRTS